MTQKGKLINRFLSLPKDFTFDEIETLLSGFGYTKNNKVKTSGSRVAFKDKVNTPIILHKPHPDSIVKKYALKQVFEELVKAGYISENEIK